MKKLKVLFLLIILCVGFYHMHDRRCNFIEVLAYRNEYYEPWLACAQHHQSWYTVYKNGYEPVSKIAKDYNLETHENLEDVLEIDVDKYTYVITHGCKLLEVRYNLLKYSGMMSGHFNYYEASAKLEPCDVHEVHIYAMPAVAIDNK